MDVGSLLCHGHLDPTGQQYLNSDCVAVSPLYWACGKELPLHSCELMLDGHLVPSDESNGVASAYSASSLQTFRLACNGLDMPDHCFLSVCRHAPDAVKHIYPCSLSGSRHRKLSSSTILSGTIFLL